MTHGLNSLQSIPDNSVDFIWSHSVLEHIKLNEFKLVSDELFRILKNGGVCVHGVDLFDHFEESLNNLKVPENIWESSLFSNSGFYTNRIRHDQMIDIFKSSDFEIYSDITMKWSELPISKNKLSKPYCHYSEENLSIYWFDLILTKNA